MKQALVGYTRSKPTSGQGIYLKKVNKHIRFGCKLLRFTLIGDSLYKRSFGGSYLKCLINAEAQYVLVKLHEGVCDNHIRDQNPRDPKRQLSENTPRNNTPPDKMPRWKCLSCKQLTCVSLTLGDSKGQFQLVHPCPNTSARAEKDIVGALSHMSTREYFHASDQVSLLSPLLRQPSRHLETSYLNHLRH